MIGKPLLLAIILFLGLPLFSSCIVYRPHDPYPLYEARWTGMQEMPESIAFRYCEEYLRTRPHFNYDRVVRVTVHWAYLSQNDPYEIWSIRATVTWLHMVTDRRSMDITVKVSAWDGRVIN